MKKANHRLAFSNDPALAARIAKQMGRENLTHAESFEARPAPKARSANVRIEKVRSAVMDSRSDQLILDSENCTLTAIFSGALLLSLNVMLRTHDAASTSLKASWQKRTEALRLENHETFRGWQSVVRYPLIVEEVYISPENGNLLDTESVSAACKPVIDSMVRSGFITDDSKAYMAQPLAFTEYGKPGGLILRFKPSPRPWGAIADDTVDLARNSLT